MSLATGTQPVTVRLAQPSANLGLTELLVTPGLMDAHARELFLYSQCQMLALAIHEKTDWPLWVAEQQLPSGAWAWVHLAVQTPAGRWLDIEGPRDDREVADWLAPWRLPVRLRLLGALAEWYAVIGVAADAAPTWWRTQFTEGPDAGIALVEAFAHSLITRGLITGHGGTS
jgi:hypothetical protein